MSGRVRGAVGPPGLTGVCVQYWRPSSWHALCCHCTSTEWKLKGVAACVSVPVQSSLSLAGVELTLTFFTPGETVLSTPVSFLFLRGIS